MPTPQVATGAVGQRGQRGTLGCTRRRGFDGVEGAAEQVGGHDAGGPGADMDAQRQKRLVVDLDGHPGTPDRAGDGQVGAFPQDSGVQEGDDLAVYRRNRQRGGLGDDVAADRAAQPNGPEHRRRGGVRELERGRDHAVTSGTSPTSGREGVVLV